jgi:Lon protease-like protein
MDDEPIGVPPVVPLFPLPGVVLFPHTIIPLHIFEPRYRTMIADALAGDSVVGIALLKPGFEPLYYTPRAPVHATIGVGHIVESEQVADGNYNLLLRGFGRAVIVDENRERLYRLAQVEPLQTYCSGGEDTTDELRGELRRQIRKNPGLDKKLRRQWLRLCAQPLALNELVDLLAAGVPAEPELRQCLLDEADAVARGQVLLAHIHTLAAIAENQRRIGQPGRHGLN